MKLQSKMSKLLCASVLCVMTFGNAAQAQNVPQGEVKGTAWQHSADSLASSVASASLVVPSKATGSAPYVGKFSQAPAFAGAKVPVVVFLHGSSGLGLKAIGEWQAWLATMGIASIAPDSFSLPNRITYKSPVDKTVYEQIHALRLSEIQPAVDAIKNLPWVDNNKLILAGTSEGAVAVARYKGAEFAAKMMFAWSCETNYFVQEPQSHFDANKPVLNIISSTDPFFSASNAWIGNSAPKGHCGAALKDNKKAAVVLIPDAPHTLLMFPAAKHAVSGFLTELNP